MGQETTRLERNDDEIRTRAPAPQVTSDDPDTIERDIEQTRNEMSGTIDEIQERLNPEALKEQAKTMAHDATIGKVVDAKDQAVGKVQEFAGQAADKVRDMTGRQHDDVTYYGRGSSRGSGAGVFEMVRANPIPAALAGAGLGWFLMRRSDSNDRRSSYMSNNPEYRSGYRGQQMDYRTGYTDWDRGRSTPGYLRDYEEDHFMNRASNTGGSVVAFIQRHPVQSALAGAGAGWWLLRRSGSGSRGTQRDYYQPSRHTTFSSAGAYDTQGYSYPTGYRSEQRSYQPAMGGYQPGYGSQEYGTQGDWQRSEDDEGRFSEMTGTVQETASETMHRAQDVGSQAVHRAQDMGSQAMDQMSHLPHQAQDQFQHLRHTYDRKMQENPLLMGAVAVGVGLAVGLLIPETRKEQQLLGERRDQLMGRAQEMAGDAVDRVQEIGQEAAHAATDAAKETAKQQEQTAQSQRPTTTTQQRGQGTGSQSTTPPTS